MALDEKTQDIIRKFQAKSLEFSKEVLRLWMKTEKIF